MVVWCFACTEIPYSSSQTLITIGTCKTPAAFIVSKNKPSEVDALPIVPQATSFPLLENVVFCSNPPTFLYIFDACAKPTTAREILPVLFKRELDHHQLSFAMGEAIAHLNHLWHNKRLKREMSADGVWRFSQM